MKRLVWPVLALALILGFWISRNSEETEEVLQKPFNESIAAVEPETPSEEQGSEPSSDPRLNRLPDGRVELLQATEFSDALYSTDNTEDDLIGIDNILRLYRYFYDTNPVGVDNSMITEQLRGRNPKRVVFVSDNSPALKGNELVDKWGTPFFFHALSGTQMEIKSAGPDREWWTEDDVEYGFL